MKGRQVTHQGHFPHGREGGRHFIRCELRYSAGLRLPYYIYREFHQGRSQASPGAHVQNKRSETNKTKLVYGVTPRGLGGLKYKFCLLFGRRVGGGWMGVVCLRPAEISGTPEKEINYVMFNQNLALSISEVFV